MEFRDLLSDKFCPSDYWLFSVVAILILMPPMGSLGSATILFVSILAWKIQLSGVSPIQLTRPEKLVTGIVCYYLLSAFACSTINAKTFNDFFLLSNNIGLIVGLSLLPMLRLNSDKTWLDKIVAATAITGISMAVIILIFVSTQAHSSNNLELLSGNPLILAYLIGYNVVFGLIFFLKHPKYSGLSLAGTVGSIFALVMTARRGPTFAVIIALLPVLILTIRNSFQKFFILIFCITAIGSITVAITGKSTYDMYNVKQLIERVKDPLNGNILERSVYLRFHMYGDGWEAFKQSPLFGHGRQNAVTATIAASIKEEGNKYSRHGFSHLHNAFLTEAVSSGIFGIIGLFGMYLIPILLTYRAAAIVRIMGISYSIYLVGYGLTNLGFYHDVTVFSYIFIISVLNSLSNFKDGRETSVLLNDEA